MHLKVNEMFYSIQGEGSRAGRPCFFIRLTGCSLKCSYCDTNYARHEGKYISVDNIVEHVCSQIGLPKSGPNVPFVEVTGGEPLIQHETSFLLNKLLEVGYEVAIETAGSHDIQIIPRNVIKIVDRKTPGSGEDKNWLDSNLKFMVPDQDELKFVLCNMNDYFWAKDWCIQRNLFSYLNIIFSSAWSQLSISELANQIVYDRLPVKLQLQLHKFIWSDAQRGV